MAISYVGGVGGIDNAPLVLPPHGSGDVVLLLTVGDALNMPDATPGFLPQTFNSGFATVPGRYRAEYRRLTGTSFTIDPNPAAGDYDRIAVIYRGVNEINIFGAADPNSALGSGGSNRLIFDARTPTPGIGSWVVAIAAIVMNGNPTDESTPPANLTRRVTVADSQRIAVYDTNGNVANYPDTNGPLFSANRQWRTATFVMQELDGAWLNKTTDDVYLISDVTITQPPPPINASLTQTIEDVTLIAEAVLPQEITANLLQTLEDVTLISDASLVDRDIAANLNRTLDAVTLSSDATIVVEPVVVCTDEPYPVEGCASIVNHAAYAALRLYDALTNALYPAIREANPVTAYDTMDDWLDRLNWQDCTGACRMPGINGLLPNEIMGECGSYVCELNYEECLTTYLKHATIVALTRLQFGGIKNLCFVNNVIEPLGAIVLPTVGRESECPNKMTIAPLTLQFEQWRKLDCGPYNGPLLCNAYIDTDLCDTQSPPVRIFPGLMAAECIVRSMFPQYNFIDFERSTEVPSLIPNLCLTEM